MSKRGISTVMVAGIIIVILVVAAVGVYIVTRPGPAPTEFTYDMLTTSPAALTWGEDVTVSVNVTNPATTEVTGNATIVLNGAVTLKKTVTLAANETRMVEFTFTNGTYTSPGLYTVTIPGTTIQNTFTVRAIARVGLVLATGGLGDKSFNDISYS